MENRARIQVAIYALIGHYLGYLLKQSARRSAPLQLVTGDIVLPEAQCADAGGVTSQVIEDRSLCSCSAKRRELAGCRWPINGLAVCSSLKPRKPEVTQKAAVEANLQTQLLSYYYVLLLRMRLITEIPRGGRGKGLSRASPGSYSTRAAPGSPPDRSPIDSRQTLSAQ
jgi:hypothetical protein